MDFLKGPASYLLSLEEKQLRNHIIVALIVLIGSCAGLIYYFQTTRNRYIVELVELHNMAKKSEEVWLESEKIKEEEGRISQLLDKNKDFNIKSYFEQFCKQHGIAAEQGWETESRSIDGNEQFDEVILRATFRESTTKKLVSILNDLDNNEIVYIKELEILKNEKTISFNITIATKKHKRFFDE